ncbi:MAG: sulfur carrier protein ThiS [Planctomycetes bacterium]|nr:sulfur carrier protein ThiS [Planctomycetota bacterium]
MRIVLNGTPSEVESGTTVADLVARSTKPTELVAVEVNKTIVRRALHATTLLADGDAVEIVTLVGGG